MDKVYYSDTTMSTQRTLAVNKQARHDYTTIQTYEAGVQLTGGEVKSCKKGSINLKGSYATFSKDTLVLRGCHISPYIPAKREQAHYEPNRERTLLLQRKELQTLIGTLKQKRYSLVPLSLYLKGGLVKVELAVVQGKKQYEKRDSLKKKAIEKDLGRKLKH